jgi:hypothetical protein
MRMKSKVVALLLVSTVACAVALISTSKAKPQPVQRQIEEMETKDKAQGLTLQERVRLAKLRNQQKITVRSSYSNTLYVGFRDMDNAADNFTIVIAKPVAAVARLDEDGRIHTSYRFKNVEVLSERGPSKYPFTFSGNFPAELGTFEEGDFMVTIRGGVMVLDGVEVTSKYDDFELFSLDKEYLLFLEFDTTGKLGALGMGPLSALTIDPDGTLHTLDRQDSHDIKQAIKSQFRDSVETLKAYLKSRARRKG